MHIEVLFADRDRDSQACQVCYFWNQLHTTPTFLPSQTLPSEPSGPALFLLVVRACAHVFRSFPDWAVLQGWTA